MIANRLHLMMLVSLLGCGDSGSPTAASRLQAKLGPAGGTIQGASGTLFAGFALSVPPGALAHDTTVTVDLVDDATPLPDLALGIGPQFAIGPDGVALAEPATLTLPFSADTAAHFGQVSTDVKVWVRAADGWTLTPPTATADATVTIAMPKLTTAAAGVKLVVKAPLPCTAAACTTCMNASGGFCVDSYGTPFHPVPVAPRYWTTAVATTSAIYFTQRYGQFAVRYDVSSHEEHPSISYVAPPSAYPGGNLVIDDDGSLWASLQFGGSAQFGFTGSSQLFDIGDDSRGIVRTASKTLVRGTITGQTARDGGRFRTVAWPSDGHYYDAVSATAESSGDGYWISKDTSIMQRFHAASLAPESGSGAVALPGAWAITSRPALGADQSIAVIGYDHASGTTGLFVANVSDAAFTQVALPVPPQDLAGDSQGGLWLTSTGRPELYYRASRVEGAGLSTIGLTGHLPIMLIPVPDGSVVVLASSGELLHVKRSH